MGERPKALLPVLIVAGVLAVAAVVAVVLLLSQPQAPSVAPSSTPTTTTTPSTPPSVTPSPSPTPTPTPDATASEIVMGARGFEVVADDGSSLLSYTWYGDAVAAVGTLTDLLGEPPVEAIIEGDGAHYPDYTSYRWDGFELRDMIEAPEGKPRSEYSIPSYVAITGADAADVAITPEFGVAIGMTPDEVRALGPDRELNLSEYEGSTSDAFRFFFAIDRQSDEPLGYSLWAITDDDGQAVTEIWYRPYSEL